MRRFFQRAGVLMVLLLLGALFSVLTVRDLPAEGGEGARRLLAAVPEARESGTVLLAAGESAQDDAFLAVLREKHDTAPAVRTPAEARAALAAAPAVVLATPTAAQWLVFDSVRDRVRTPAASRGSVFLSVGNLVNIANQISVIGILAIGMTMVIIVRGIDLSVGSVIAFSSVVTAWLLATHFGGPGASTAAMLAAAAAGVAVGAAFGAGSGTMVARWGVPSFIATLGIMQIASGAAFKLSGGQSINAVPASFNWLGLQSTAGLPHAVWLLLVVAVVAHVFMTQTVMGRHIYAVGGNPEAARFSGISLVRVRLTVFTACGALAGLGGVVYASQFTSGSPNYGQLAELDAIAAAVVGGTSLEGGRGNIFGTLVGALIIAVIRNGMNLTGVDFYSQKIWLGVVILAAVLLDRWTRRGTRVA